eukprot:CAMPEP_0176132578 /NCGR_PEP_ID=MMETSP0120_2-20121206/67163_1 /TAXON_ID=160619 /ORGANISM="Kryptoperidinium foliaceum, Strain CCMP 1326" /LENGTH=351 /DNA_ID=CAMNT_0017468059 /DNA_START=60 /DNA_END=1115 /DNA_ORIENTATION=-
MPKGAKRTGECHAAAAAKKPRANPNFAGVQAGIEMHSALPESVKKMLLACIPNGLGVPADERGGCQEQAVRMIGEVMEEVRMQLQRAVDAEEEKMREIEASKAELEAAVAAATSVMAGVEEEVQTKTASLEAATAASGAAKAELSEKTEANIAAGREHDAAVARLKSAEASVAEHFAPLVAGGAGSFEALLPLLEGTNVDASLISALPSICAKAGAERGSFDAVAIEELGKALEAKVSALRGPVREGEQAAQVRVADIQAATAKAEEAAQSQAAAADDLAAAMQRKQQASDEVDKARTALGAHEPALGAADESRSKAKAALDEYVAYNILCYEVLRDDGREPSKAPAQGGA